MGKRFLASAGALSGARLLTALSQLLVLPIIARYLTAEEFGLVALAMTLVLFAQLFSDAGLSRSLIRQEQYHPEEWSAVFWLLFGIGLGLALIALAIAPVWAWVFEAPELFGMVAALSVTPMFLSLAAVPNARLERENRFGTLALIRAGAALAGMMAAAALALAGAGVWAMVVQQILLTVIQCGAGLAFSGFRPMLPRWQSQLSNHLIFARDSLGASLLQTTQRQVPMMLIGHHLGPASLGLFSMTSRLLNQPSMALSGPMAQVVYVRMAAAQGDDGQLGALYVGSIRLLALAIFPPMAVLAGAGGDLFALLLSEPWRKVGFLFALAAPGFALEAAVATAGVMFQAVGRTGLRLRMIVERTVLRLVTLALAVPFGIEAVALAITLFVFAYTPRYWAFAHRAVPFDRRAALSALGMTTGISVVTWGAMYLLARQGGDWATLGWAVVILAASWAAAAAIQWSRLRASLATFGR
ncbi:oligosaccharide flippase family protein [Ruegeria sp. 2012CJ41-6]|uniref:Oligosaccharide flippase family protein n=1 Tax=Ruegeria spongiae TaxID=2942209 RepID=A0ABT0Q9R3_9RHOB|nr:oligosaccharide flippase family protein [Ruegeria spongiae]MCL6285634.1 oligosaccharide flippase family protein [Ruegeria spongiae]